MTVKKRPRKKWPKEKMADGNKAEAKNSKNNNMN